MKIYGKYLLINALFLVLLISCKENKTEVNSGSHDENAKELALETAKKNSAINENDADFIGDVLDAKEDPDKVQKSREAYLRKTLGDEAYEQNEKFKEALKKGDLSSLDNGNTKGSEDNLSADEKALKIKQAQEKNERMLNAHSQNINDLKTKMLNEFNKDVSESQIEDAKEFVKKMCKGKASKGICQMYMDCEKKKDCKDYNLALVNVAKMQASKKVAAGKK